MARTTTQHDIDVTVQGLNDNWNLIRALIDRHFPDRTAKLAHQVDLLDKLRHKHGLTP